jgi:hypothetical protein
MAAVVLSKVSSNVGSEGRYEALSFMAEAPHIYKTSETSIRVK